MKVSVGCRISSTDEPRGDSCTTPNIHSTLDTSVVATVTCMNGDLCCLMFVRKWTEPIGVNVNDSRVSNFMFFSNTTSSSRVFLLILHWMDSTLFFYLVFLRNIMMFDTGEIVLSRICAIFLHDSPHFFTGNFCFNCCRNNRNFYNPLAI